MRLPLRLVHAAPDEALAGEMRREAAHCPGLRLADEAAGPEARTLLLNPARIAEEADLYALLHRERAAGRTVAALVTDDPDRFDANYALSALVDRLWTNDGNAALYYHSDRVSHLPPATAHEDADLPDPERDVLIVAGASEADASLVAAVRDAAPDAVLLPPDAPEVMAEAARCRVVVRYPRYAPGGGNRLFGLVPSTPDALTFALAERGVCQAVFLRQPELRDYFPPSAVAAFDSAASLRATLGGLLSDEAARRAMAAEARSVARGRHLWRHRWAALQEAMGNP